MPTIEELEEKLAQASADRDLLSAELSAQAEQFARWRGSVAAIAHSAFASDVEADERIALIKYQVEAVCGA